MRNPLRKRPCPTCNDSEFVNVDEWVDKRVKEFEAKNGRILSDLERRVSRWSNHENLTRGRPLIDGRVPCPDCTIILPDLSDLATLADPRTLWADRKVLVGCAIVAIVIALALYGWVAIFGALLDALAQRW
jgi:hypothetical protein